MLLVQQWAVKRESIPEVRGDFERDDSRLANLRPVVFYPYEGDVTKCDTLLFGFLKHLASPGTPKW
jgi:hypothetical protein